MQFEMIFDFKEERPVDVLDVGCGDGFMARLWASRNFSYMRRERGMRYCGMDLDKGVINQARSSVPRNRSCLPSARFIEHDICKKWPFSGSRFDLVWYTEAVEHVPATKASFTIREAFRVLRRGGCCVLSTPAPLTEKLCWPEVHDHEFSRETTEKFIRNAGFEVLQTVGTGTNWHLNRKLVSLASKDLYKRLRPRIGGALARAVVIALEPDAAEGLCWTMRKP
jgi:SAM-dependent methyltransferase